MKAKRLAAFILLVIMVFSMTACGKPNYKEMKYSDYAALEWDKKKVQYEFYSDANADGWESWYPIYAQLYKDGGVRITEYSFAPARELVEYGNWEVENNELVIRYWKDGEKKADKIKCAVSDTMKLTIPSKLTGKDRELEGSSKIRYGGRDAFSAERSAGKTYSIRTELIPKDAYRIAFIGDSITFGAAVTPEERYSTLVGKEPWVLSADNYGISGTTITRTKNTLVGAEQCFIDRVLDITEAPDVVFILGGTNDFYLFAHPMGDPDSVDDETFYGALNSLIARISALYPDALIVFGTPIHRTDGGNNTQNKAGYYLEDFRNAIIDVCERTGLPCIDLYSNPNMQASDPNYNSLLADKLHPNTEGNQVLAKAVTEGLESILF